ncbi:unnamed protein product [Prunus armeniaca]|uniref:Uncharacterized protein n=1 Tax=Prunus armeniaca TaxID=36596 RepID=A0A6J5U7F6_PRUAR|nr:unnamed protein product [Prunus armeniaca]
MRSKIAEDDRYVKTLLSFSNLFKASLIDEAEKTRREKEEGSGRAMSDAMRRQPNSLGQGP